ncbi:MAG TPA: metallophosphoesterase [Gammaproteobacteria bacterium]|nr:metallophosphoesterase [Gammaproteobacteria bacterium]
MLFFGGDPHGHFAQIERVARDAGPDDALVLLGDFDLPAPLEQVIPAARDRTWWIHGNHDCDRTEWYDRLFGSALAARCLHGQVVRVGGLRVAGMGGVFREKVWHPESPKGVRAPARADYLRLMRPPERWRGGLPLKHHASIWWEDYERLWAQRADILVTHEAPSAHRHGFAAIDDLAAAMGARMIVHGHHHETYTAALPDGVRVLGVGLAEVVDETGNTVASAGSR